MSLHMLKKISELNGLGFKTPMIFFAYTLGALSIIGVPPFDRIME